MAGDETVGKLKGKGVSMENSNTTENRKATAEQKQVGREEKKQADLEAKERAYLRRQKLKEEKEERLAVERLATQKKEQKEKERFMREAIKLAKKAAALGEVPIGCVLVCNGEIVARGYNRRNTDKTTLAHAEVAVIKKASRKFQDWRLENCTLYVTLEPCPMCAGAIVQARIPKVVAGCMNPKAGCAGSVLNILRTPGLNHMVDFESGVLEEDCSRLLRDFFRELRQKGRKIEK